MWRKSTSPESDRSAETTEEAAARESRLLRQRGAVDLVLKVTFLPAAIALSFVVILLTSVLVTFLSNTTGFSEYYGVDPQHPFRSVPFWIGTGILTFVFGLLAFRARLSNALADIVFRADAPSGPYILYLRSFFVDEALKTSSQMFDGMSQFDSLQTRLGRAFKDHVTVIKIGSRAMFDASGSTITTTDSQWFNDFKKLAASARLIVMTPIVVNPRSGTARELREIGRRGWQAKTILIAPSDRRVWQKWGPVFWRVLIRDLWRRSRVVTQRIAGMEIPYYRGHALMVPQSKGWAVVSGVAGRYWDHPKSLAYLLDPTTPAEPVSWSAVRIANRMVFLQIVLWPVLIVMAVWMAVQGAVLQIPEGFGKVVYLAALLFFLAFPYFRFCRRFTLSDSDALTLYAVTVTAALGFLFVVGDSRVYENWMYGVVARMGISKAQVPDYAVFPYVLSIWIATFVAAFGTLRVCKPIPRWQPPGPPHTA